MGRRHNALNLVLLSFCIAALCCADASAASMPVAPGVNLIAGAFVPGQQPDGNSVLIRAPHGLIVIDTGRHIQHTQQIIDFARQANLPIEAIINSHWHLDHIGGNSRIRALYPGVQIYASDALTGAMDGFLARYKKYLEGVIEKSPHDPNTQASRDELAIIDNAPSASPTEVVTKSGNRAIAGYPLVLHLESNSVTAGDVWVFDPATRVLIAGDLVTLPVPFLDTACPARWGIALGDLNNTNFKIIIPGHGPPMHRREFNRYRHAYDGLLACSHSTRSKNECIDGWLDDAGSLIPDKDRSYAKSMLDSYMDTSLRANPANIAKLCAE
jgi:glyoxylase-like metal-dependent hydrolase (beta-lactamase superfamily II)